MNPASTNLLLIIHFMALAGLVLYGVHRILLLAYWWLKYSPSVSQPQFFSPLKNFPKVTVQLPLYNERFVAMRILDAAAVLKWPRERIEIQVLDDSTDDTQRIVDERAAHWLEKGISIKVIRRLRRDGYKAGALGKGLTQASGEFIAIFDADFIPPPDFLNRTIPYFSNPEVGMVQAKWGFLNAERSWLTRVQSLLLSPHFGIEHWVRFRLGLFFNFNGTAGIWRKKAIESAGGWQSDTVTEDLDLSYRAQLAGWRFVYLDEVVVPSELPVTIAAFRSQQQRWAKGSIQTAKKILPALIHAPLPVKVKIEATVHLLSNFGWVLGTIVILTLFPTILLRVNIGPYQIMWLDLPLFLMANGTILLYFFLYAIMQKERSSIFWLPLIPVVSIGLATTLAMSVLEGILNSGGIFERTPKFGLKAREPLPKLAILYHRQALQYIFINIIILAYIILPIIFAWQRGTWLAIPFLTIFPLGFSLIIYKDIIELISLRLTKENEAGIFE